MVVKSDALFLLPPSSSARTLAQSIVAVLRRRRGDFPISTHASTCVCVPLTKFDICVLIKKTQQQQAQGQLEEKGAVIS